MNRSLQRRSVTPGSSSSSFLVPDKRGQGALQRVFEWAWLSLYTLFGLIFYAMYAPWLLLRHTVAGHAKTQMSNGFLLRLGLVPSAIGKVESPVWFHAVSVGEMLTIVPLIKTFRSRHPGIPALVTTVTEAGQRAAIQALEGTGCIVAYFPLDILPVVSRVLSRVNPRLLCLAKTRSGRRFCSCSRKGAFRPLWSTAGYPKGPLGGFQGFLCFGTR